MMNIGALANELRVDPLAHGYSGMTDAQAAVDLNAVYRTRVLTTLSSAQIYERTDITEFQSKNAAQQTYVRDIWGLGDSVAVGVGSKARTVYLAVFSASSNTASNIGAALAVSISRAEELGLGIVLAAHVQKARAQMGG